MNNLDTQQSCYIAKKILYFFKATEKPLYKDGKRTEEAGRNQSNDLRKQDPREDIIIVKIPERWEDVKGF